MTVAASLPRCACGTFAIGLCATCETPVCGDDSSRDDGQRLCRRCKGEREKERARLGGLLAEERRIAAQQRRNDAGIVLAAREEKVTCGHNWTQIAPDGRCWTCEPAR